MHNRKMGLFDIKCGKLNVPLYDIGTLAAGFFVGYNEGKGIEISPSVEYLTKYAPTVFALTATPIMIKLTTTFGKWVTRTVAQDVQRGDLEITLSDGSKEKYDKLDENQKQEITPNIVEGINTLESKLQDSTYLKPTLICGTRTAVETTIGYIAGRLYTHIN